MNMSGVSGAGASGMSGMASCREGQQSGKKNTNSATSQAAAVSKAQPTSLDPNSGNKVDIAI